jgi:dihydrofolate reductase
MLISLVAAMAKNRVIGYSGRMPWHLPAELAHFKKITFGKPILMGRRTFLSIGKPLPGRRNLVLSRKENLQIPGCEVYSSLEASLEASLKALNESGELMVIGGAELFEQTLPLANRLYLTFIDCDLPGDTFFPPWKEEQWVEVENNYHPADALNVYAFHSVRLDRFP